MYNLRIFQAWNFGLKARTTTTHTAKQLVETPRSFERQQFFRNIVQSQKSFVFFRHNFVVTTDCYILPAPVQTSHHFPLGFSTVHSDQPAFVHGATSTNHIARHKLDIGHSTSGRYLKAFLAHAQHRGVISHFLWGHVEAESEWSRRRWSGEAAVRPVLWCMRSISDPLVCATETFGGKLMLETSVIWQNTLESESNGCHDCYYYHFLPAASMTSVASANEYWLGIRLVPRGHEISAHKIFSWAAARLESCK